MIRALPAPPSIRGVLLPDSTRERRALLRLVALLEACGASLMADVVRRKVAKNESVDAPLCWMIACRFSRSDAWLSRRQIARDAGRHCLAHDPSGMQCDVDPGTHGHTVRGQAHHVRGRWWWT